MTALQYKFDFRGKVIGEMYQITITNKVKDTVSFIFIFFLWLKTDITYILINVRKEKKNETRLPVEYEFLHLFRHCFSFY